MLVWVWYWDMVDSALNGRDVGAGGRYSVSSVIGEVEDGIRKTTVVVQESVRKKFIVYASGVRVHGAGVL